MAMTLRGPRVCRAVLVVAATAGMLIGTQAAAAADVPQDVPSPCADPLAMPEWCLGIPPGPLKPALDISIKDCYPDCQLPDDGAPADPADGLGAAGPPGNSNPRVRIKLQSFDHDTAVPSGQALGRGLDIARVDGQVVNASSGV